MHILYSNHKQKQTSPPWVPVFFLWTFINNAEIWDKIKTPHSPQKSMTVSKYILLKSFIWTVGFIRVETMNKSHYSSFQVPCSSGSLLYVWCTLITIEPDSHMEQRVVSILCTQTCTMQTFIWGTWVFLLIAMRETYQTHQSIIYLYA